MKKRNGPFLYVNNTTSHIVVFTTEEKLTFLGLCDCILMDGTFDISPKLFKLLLIIILVHGKKNMYVPLIFGILHGKSTSDYEGLFKHVKNQIQPTYEPPTVYIDLFSSFFFLFIWFQLATSFTKAMSLTEVFDTR